MASSILSSSNSVPQSDSDLIKSNESIAIDDKKKET